MEKYRVVITGASGGIGYHLVIGFLEAGFDVIALDHVLHRALPEEVAFYQVDLSDPEAVRDFFRRLGRPVHVLVNNAAVTKFEKQAIEVSIDDFSRVMDVNLRGAYLCAQGFIELNKGETYGRIINIASTRFHQNEANWELYGMSKGAMISMTNTLCVSLADTPITVNAISPGWICTSGYDELSVQDHSQHPSGRVGRPLDIVKACLYIADPENDFVNGANLIIDGGMTKKMIYV